MLSRSSIPSFVGKSEDGISHEFHFIAPTRDLPDFKLSVIFTKCCMLSIFTFPSWLRLCVMTLFHISGFRFA